MQKRNRQILSFFATLIGVVYFAMATPPIDESGIYSDAFGFPFPWWTFGRKGLGTVMNWQGVFLDALFVIGCSMSAGLAIFRFQPPRLSLRQCFFAMSIICIGLSMGGTLLTAPALCVVFSLLVPLGCLIGVFDQRIALRNKPCTVTTSPRCGETVNHHESTNRGSIGY